MIFFRYGEDDFQIQRANQQHLAELKILSAGLDNTQSFSATELEWPTLANALNNQSLFQTTRAVVLSNPFSSKNQPLITGLISLLTANFLTEQTTTWLLINEDHLKLKYQSGQYQPALVDLDGRAKALNKNQQILYRLLTAVSTQYQYYPKLNGAEAENLLEKLAKEKNSQLTPSAQRLLLQLTNYNFWQISHELNKITNYQASLDQKQPIDETIIHLLVNDTANHIFELITAICSQQLATTTKLLNEILTDETDLAVSVALLNRQALQFLQIKARLEAGQAPAVIEKSLGLPLSIGQKIVRQATTINMIGLRQLINNLTKFDWSSKRSRGNLLALLTLLLINHTNQK
jgi:DNA polymerase III delta subunit